MNSRSIWWKIILRLLLCYLLVQLAPAVVVIASGIVFGPITTPDAAVLSSPDGSFVERRTPERRVVRLCA